VYGSLDYYAGNGGALLDDFQFSIGAKETGTFSTFADTRAVEVRSKTRLVIDASTVEGGTTRQARCV
jgi:hypothetical protein